MNDFQLQQRNLDALTDLELETLLVKISDFVKEHEGDEEVRSIEIALPQLCKYLLYDDGPYLIMECMASIFRRVHISKETINELRSLYKQNPQSILISVFSNLTSQQWSNDTEEFIMNQRHTFPTSVIHTMYEQSHGKLKSKSLALLSELLLPTEKDKDGNHLNKMYQSRLISTLCNQTQNENFEQATNLLLSLLPHLDESLTIDTIQQLSYFSNKGISIFNITAASTNPIIRLETVKSLGRSKEQTNKTLQLLTTLSNDSDDDVKSTALTILNNPNKH